MKTLKLIHKKTNCIKIQSFFSVKEIPLWKEKNLFKIHKILKAQNPGTYIISQVLREPEKYYLFYVRPEDNEVVQVEFCKTTKNKWKYLNVAGYEGPIEWLIDKIMHRNQYSNFPMPKPYTT